MKLKASFLTITDLKAVKIVSITCITTIMHVIRRCVGMFLECSRGIHPILSMTKIAVIKVNNIAIPHRFPKYTAHNRITVSTAYKIKKLIRYIWKSSSKNVDISIRNPKKKIINIYKTIIVSRFNCSLALPQRQSQSS